MKTVWMLLVIGVALSPLRVRAQAGLKGEYFNGTNFETKVATRIDPQISFNWRGRSPVPGIGESYFSVRWTGKLYAPASGEYIFSAVVDDGIRVWVGNKKIIDAWGLHDDDSFRGSVVLKAGQYYDFRVEYFNDMLEGKINLLWHRPDDTSQVPPLVDARGRPIGDPTTYQSIAGQYLYRTPPPAPRPLPLPKPKVTPVAIVTPPKPKPVAKPATTSVGKPKPVAVATPPPSLTPAAPTKTPVAETFENLAPGQSLVLKSVFFAQSTYVLLPESFPELDKLVRTLQQHAAIRIGIGGHTDNVGDPRLNQSLSEFRARVVMNYLTRHGIAEDRVEAFGYGGSRPLTGNTTESERAQNRRVEFVVK